MREPQTINWAGGEHPFLLRIGDRLALEASCDSGVGAILARLMTSEIGTFEWRQNDVIETLRLGLIGAGMDRDTARALVHKADAQVGLIGLSRPALAVLWGNLQGDAGDIEEDEPESPADAEAVKKKVTPTEG